MNYMNKKEEFLNKVIGWYRTKRILEENKDLSIPFDEKEIDEIDNKIRDNSSKIIKMLKDKDFLEALRKLINEQPDRFQVAFAQPYDEEVINCIVFDLWNKKTLTKKQINELKSVYSSKNISIYTTGDS